MGNIAVSSNAVDPDFIEIPAVIQVPVLPGASGITALETNTRLNIFKQSPAYKSDPKPAQQGHWKGERKTRRLSRKKI